jgi:hypothetical protein
VEVTLPSKIGRIDSLSLSPDGTSLITGAWGEGLSWWKLGKDSNEPRRFPGERALFSKDGKTLVTTGGDGFGVWDAVSGNAVTNFTTDSLPGFSTALSPDGLLLAAGSDPQEIDNAIRLWDTHTANFLAFAPVTPRVSDVSLFRPTENARLDQQRRHVAFLERQKPSSNSWRSRISRRSRTFYFHPMEAFSSRARRTADDIQRAAR